MSRPSWDEVWLGIADVMATRSACSRSQVGVVIVDGGQRIRSTGYNGPPAGLKPSQTIQTGCVSFCPRARALYGHSSYPLPGDDVATLPCGFESEGEPGLLCRRPRGHAMPGEPSAGHDDCVASHAEANALMFGDREERLGGTLYSTRVPCFTCAKMVANSGVARVVCRIHPDKDRHLDPRKSLALLRSCGLEVVVADATEEQS